MTIQYTITIGEILTAISLVLTVGAAFVAVKLDVRELLTMMRPMWKWFHETRDVERKELIALIEHDTRAIVQTALLENKLEKAGHVTRR